jgi:putative ABC transport system permease protein
MRDVAYAFRAFARTPLTSLTIVTTVALGLGLVTMVFTLLNRTIFRVDAVNNPHELFGVERPRTSEGERVLLTRPYFEALRRETDVFADSVAMLEDLEGRIDGRMMSGTLVTGNFFQVLGVNAALGRTLTPRDDERDAPNPVMVLSHRGWSSLFNRDPTVIGHQVIVNGFPCEIVGVMPESFRGLTVGPPDYWSPLSLLDQIRPIHRGKEDSVGIDIVGRLKPGWSRESAQARLSAWAAGRENSSGVERRAGTLTLVPRQGTVPQPAEALLVFTPILFAFGLILMIGCANVANLLLARGVSRQREIGMRLSLGASRGRVIRQLLTESLLLALASAALGFVISRVAFYATVNGILSTIAPEFLETIRLSVPAADWRVVVFLIVGAVLSTVLFGLAPALQATRLDLVRTIRGEITADARPGRTRNVLIGMQVTASVLLLICAAVFLRSAMASSAQDPGFRTSDTVIVQVANEPLRDAMVRAVAADPIVTRLAVTSPDMLDAPRAGLAETPAAKSSVAYRFVSPEYFDVYGIDLLRGRSFLTTERTTDAAVVVVSESVARQLWPDGDAVGQAVHLAPDPSASTERLVEPPLPPRTFTVVGVVRDVAGFRIARYKEAGVYVPITAATARSSLIVRVQGNPEVARSGLLSRLTTVDPNMGQVVTMKALATLETFFLQVAFSFTVVLGGLALILTLSGLFSVLSYLVEQRRKEIGVRMALGATARDVGRLVLSQSIRPVGIGLAAGSALALGLAVVLLATPVAAEIGRVVHVFDPVAYGASLVCIAVACALAALFPTMKATRVDPMTTLRQD